VERLKSILGNMAAVIYFLAVMWWILLMLVFVPFVLVSDINTIRSSGFSTSNMGTTYIGVFGLFIGLSLLVPVFRKMYYKLPWMFPFVKILYLNVIIMSIATMILNYGYEVQSQTRHTVFFVLIICQIIICRIIMCIYFSKRKVQYIGGDADGQ
jgi:hypothetical protein